MLPRRPKTAPRRLQDGPKTAPRRSPENPKTTQKGPKTAQHGSMTAKTAPRRPQDGPKTAPRWPQNGPKTALKCHRIRAKLFRNAFVNPATAYLASTLLIVASSWAQLASKGLQDGFPDRQCRPKTIKKPRENQHFEQNVAVHRAGSSNALLASPLLNMGPRWPQYGPKMANDSPGWPMMAPGGP